MTSPDAKAKSQSPRVPSALERAQEEYLNEVRAHRQPRVEHYIQRLPQHERELLAFAFYAETIAADLPEFDAVPEARLNQPAQDAIARIAQTFAPSNSAGVLPGTSAPRRRTPAGGASTLISLAEVGREASATQESLAERVGLTPDILILLDQRAIEPETIPLLLVERLADTLGIRAQVVASYLRAPSARKVAEAPAAYSAQTHAPLPRISFSEAVRASMLLGDERKREWASLAGDEAPRLDRR